MTSDATSSGAGVRTPRRGIAIAVATFLVLAAAGVATAMVVSGDDTHHVDAAVFSVGLAMALDDVEYVDGAAELDACPLGSMDGYVAAIDAVVPIDDAVSIDSTNAYQDTESFPAGVYCNRSSDDDANTFAGPTAVSVSVSALPDQDYRLFLQTVFDNEYTVIDEPIEDGDAVIYSYCVDAADERGQTGCGADWVDEAAGVALAVYLGAERDSASAVEAVRAVLPVAESEIGAIVRPGS